MYETLIEAIKNTSDSLVANQAVASLYSVDIELLAKSILFSYKGLIKKAGNKNIVVLGRDAEPLFWILKEKGHKCQYLLFSRLQENDSSTTKVVKEEVPAGSLVVDTGFEGSIIDMMGDMVPSLSGMLINSHVKDVYPQIVFTKENGYYPRHDTAVKHMEYFPKIVKRSCGFDKAKDAIFSTKSWDWDCGVELSMDRAIAVREVLCNLIGVSKQWAKYTGTTREERLNGILL